MYVSVVALRPGAWLLCSSHSLSFLCSTGLVGKQISKLGALSFNSAQLVLKSILTSKTQTN